MRPLVQDCGQGAARRRRGTQDASEEPSKRETVATRTRRTPYRDAAAIRHLAFTQRLKAGAPHPGAKRARASHRDFKEALERDGIDVALEHRRALSEMAILAGTIASLEIARKAMA